MPRLIKALLLSTATITAANAAQAQAADTLPANSDQAASGDIVVTAQRRAESAQRVPISLTAVSGEQLEVAGIRDVGDLKRVAPSFFAGSPPQAAGVRVNIRGLGSPGSTDPSVASFVDGIYIARPGALLGNLLDIDRVEVLSGPQGTLFGRNASVGALNIVTGEPQFTPEGRASLEYGTQNRARVTLVDTGPISDTLAARIAASFDRFDGYGYNRLDGKRVGGQDSVSVRAGLRLKTGSVDWTVRGDYQYFTGDGIAIVTVDQNSVTPAFAANFQATTGNRAPRLTGTYDQIIDQQAGGRITNRNYGVASDFKLALGDYTLRLISGVRDWYNVQDELDLIYTAAPILGRTASFFSRTHSEELQLISPSNGALSFVGGLYYFHEYNGSDGQSNLGSAYCDTLVPLASRPACRATLGGVYPATGAGLWHLDQRTDSYAAYGQATLALTPAFKLTAGGRYSRDVKNGSVLFRRPNPFLGSVVVPDNDALHAAWGRFTYRLNATYNVTPDAMIFATYSTGYKSGGFDQSTGIAANANRVFQPEFSKNYEFGIKSQFLDRRVTANATLFRTSVDNLQVRSFDAATASFNTRNAGSVRQQGVEFELRAKPVPALTLGVAATYLDSAYTDFRNAPALPRLTGTQDLTGQRSSFSPKWQGVASADYTGRINERLGFSLNTNLSFTSAQYVGAEVDNNPQGVQPGFAQLGARIAVFGADRAWEFAVTGENLTDKGYCIAKFSQPGGVALGVAAAGSNVERCILGQPRTVRGSITFRF